MVLRKLINQLAISLEISSPNLLTNSTVKLGWILDMLDHSKFLIFTMPIYKWDTIIVGLKTQQTYEIHWHEWQMNWSRKQKNYKDIH